MVNDVTHAFFKFSNSHFLSVSLIRKALGKNDNLDLNLLLTCMIVALPEEKSTYS